MQSWVCLEVVSEFSPPQSIRSCYKSLKKCTKYFQYQWKIHHNPTPARSLLVTLLNTIVLYYITTDSLQAILIGRFSRFRKHKSHVCRITCRLSLLMQRHSSPTPTITLGNKFLLFFVPGHKVCFPNSLCLKQIENSCCSTKTLLL